MENITEKLRELEKEKKMNGIVRKEKMKQERIIRHLWLKMNHVDRDEQKRLDKRIQYHVKCLERAKQLEVRV